jgi:Rrf2 family protein
LSFATDYEIQLLLYLARKNSVVSLAELSCNLKISREYVCRLGRKLSRTGYVRIKSGRLGGLELMRSPKDITLYDVLHIKRTPNNPPTRGEIFQSETAEEKREQRSGPISLPTPPNFIEVVREWESRKLTFDEALERTGLKRSSFFNRLRELRVAEGRIVLPK